MKKWGFPGGSEVEASVCKAGGLGSIPGSGRSPGEGNGNPLQKYVFFLRNIIRHQKKRLLILCAKNFI